MAAVVCDDSYHSSRHACVRHSPLTNPTHFSIAPLGVLATSSDPSSAALQQQNNSKSSRAAAAEVFMVQ
jgi:hypothetical protein